MKRRGGEEEKRGRGEEGNRKRPFAEPLVKSQECVDSPLPLFPSSLLLLFLIGPRGSGKSTIARLLAGRIGWDWVDADDLIEERYGKSIRTIFTEEGEASFRDKEATILAELCDRRRCVVSTGGGVVVRPANRQLLRASGYVVWLTADTETLWRRLQSDGDHRPALGVGGLAEVEEILRLRQPWYEECAHLTVRTEGKAPEALAEEILVLSQMGSNEPRPLGSGGATQPKIAP